LIAAVAAREHMQHEFPTGVGSPVAKDAIEVRAA
jgi:hypothetical protein